MKKTRFVNFWLPYLVLLLLTAQGYGASAMSLTPDSSSVIYRKEKVSFQSGDHTLRGVLVSPKQAKGKVPAIVFCVGSGKGSTVASYATFLDSLLEQTLPLDSIALLYFDKRGIGESEGKWYKADFEQRAADAKAAADYLASLPFVDKDRIAVVGHSQGGWITQVCLARYPETFAGGISLAGPTFGVREQVQNDYASTLMCNSGLPEEAAWQKGGKQVNRSFFVVSLLPVNDNWKQLRVIKKFEPAAYLTSTKRPLMLMFAENDRLVSPRHSLAALDQLFPQGIPENIRTVVVPGANHSFKVAEFCQQGSTRDLPYAPESKRYIKAWVREHLLGP